MTENRWGLAGRLVAVVALVLTGCTSDQGDGLEGRDAAVYRAVIDDLSSRYPVQTEDPETLPTLFVEAFDPEGIPLEVQVDLVARFEENFVVRFIDDRVEAIDVDLPDSPVRLESILVGVGPVPGTDPVEVRAELYVAESDIRAYRYRLDASPNDEWSIAETMEIEPEGFGAAP